MERFHCTLLSASSPLSHQCHHPAAQPTHWSAETTPNQCQAHGIPTSPAQNTEIGKGDISPCPPEPREPFCSRSPPQAHADADPASCCPLDASTLGLGWASWDAQPRGSSSRNHGQVRR